MAVNRCRVMTKKSICLNSVKTRIIPNTHRICRYPLSNVLTQRRNTSFADVKTRKRKRKVRCASSVLCVPLTWSLRKSKLKTGERVRQNPIRETGSRYNRLKVPKLGEIKIRQHRPFLGDPKEVTLKKTARGNRYCFIVCEVPDTLKCVPKSACGVDVGIQDFLTTSEGEKIPNPRFYRTG